MDPKFAVLILFLLCVALGGYIVVKELKAKDEYRVDHLSKRSVTPLPEEERAEAKAILEGFKRYNARGDIHEEERGMSSQMYEAGWEDAKEYFTGKTPQNHRGDGGP